MHSYEYRTNSKKPWRQCDREEALTLLYGYGDEAETVLKRIDAGEVVTGATCQMRIFDPSTAPFANRPLPGQNEHGDYIFAQ